MTPTDDPAQNVILNLVHGRRRGKIAFAHKVDLDNQAQYPQPQFDDNRCVYRHLISRYFMMLTSGFVNQTSVKL